MSEPDSLYLRVRLSKQAYERYLASPGADARDFPDWMDWLGKVQMHGPGFTPERIAEIGRETGKCSPADGIAAWTSSDWAMGKSAYDEATGTWRFGILQFSENYLECLGYLPPLRAVCQFKDRPGVDFMLVYNHFWSPGEYMALFEFTEGASTFAGSSYMGVPLPKHYAEEASAFIDALHAGRAAELDD